MPKYVIERNVPGAGALSKSELHAIAVTSCNVIENMGPRIQWVHSYVAEDKIFCIYIADSKEQVREHASQGHFDVTSVNEVATMIDPTTSE